MCVNWLKKLTTTGEQKHEIHTPKHEVSCWISHTPSSRFLDLPSKGMAALEIKYRDIPLYLHAGDFNRNLDSDDPEGIIEIPADCFHPHGQTAADLEDFRRLLRVMVFWILDDIPLGVLEFCNEHEVDVWNKSLVDLPGAVEVEVQPLLLTAFPNPEIVPLHDIISTGRWNLIVHAVGRSSKTSHATTAAANCGNQRLLMYLHENGFVWSEDTCAAASHNGHLECLQYAHENGSPWDVQVYFWSATYGHLPCMQYAHEQGLEWHLDVCTCAAKFGQLNCLQFAHENGCPWDDGVCFHAAMNGHLSCMQYAFEQGLEWHQQVCEAAASFGHLNCLQFAHENGCPWDGETTRAAALEGHVHCLQYALEHGCPVDGRACIVACGKGHVECLQLLHQFGASWDAHAPMYATECPRVDCLQYLHENGCPWDASTTARAALNGHIEPVRYAMEQGCPYFDHVVERAACGGNLECLRYLVEEQGLHMAEEVFMTALLRGDISCLQYLIDQGCPLDDMIFPDDAKLWEQCDTYFRRDNPEFVLCIALAVERGWVPDQSFVDYIATRDQPCMQWLFENYRREWRINIYALHPL